MRIVTVCKKKKKKKSGRNIDLIVRDRLQGELRPREWYYVLVVYNGMEIWYKSQNGETSMSQWTLEKLKTRKKNIYVRGVKVKQWKVWHIYNLSSRMHPRFCAFSFIFIFYRSIVVAGRNGQVLSFVVCYKKHVWRLLSSSNGIRLEWTRYSFKRQVSWTC